MYAQAQTDRGLLTRSEIQQVLAKGLAQMDLSAKRTLIVSPRAEL